MPREPVGVVAAITPWDVPAAMVTRNPAPALASGIIGANETAAFVGHK